LFWFGFDRWAKTAGTLKDFLMLDLANMTWTDLSTSVLGNSPSSRYGHGFTSAGGKIYVQGGSSISGTQSDVLVCLPGNQVAE
jgi:hypothetical protein